MAASLGWKHQWPVRPHGHGAVKVFLYPRVLEALDCLDAVVDEYLLVRQDRDTVAYGVQRIEVVGYQKHREAQCIAQGQNQLVERCSPD